MLADYHVHTIYSDDSEYPMAEVVRDAIAMGLNEICFTDHVDYGIKRDWDDPRGMTYRSGGPGEPERMAVTNVNYPKYAAEINALQQQYKDRITIRIGMEFGMQQHTIPEYEKLFHAWPFDFIILSVHQVEDKEFWTQDFQRGRTQEEYNLRYYEEMLQLVRRYHDYSVLGHMDLISRYDKAGPSPFERIRPVVSEILKTVIADGKGIEVNTSSHRYGLKDLTPSVDILSLYRELGGRIITIGSDPKHWVIDEEPAKIIREIFKLYLNGKNATQIADIMAEKGYDAPGDYLAKRNQYTKGKAVTLETKAMWHPGTILNILDRQEYCGHTVSYRRKSVSYKTHKSVQNPESDWIITKNTQDAIVDEETWETVHKMRESGRRRKENVWDKGPLNGFLYCPDCGSKLYFSHPSRLKTSGIYMCGYFIHYKKCTSHYIRRDELEPAVLAQLRTDCAFAKEHEAEFVGMVEKKTRRNGDDAVKKAEKEYAEAKARIAEIDQIINQLYEDKVGGGLTAERFSKMLATYETEQEGLRTKCEQLQVQITAAKTTSDNAKQFIRMVKKFTEVQELTPEIVSSLIERVEVGQAQTFDGVKKQEIKIIYNFIGNIKE